MVLQSTTVSRLPAPGRDRLAIEARMPQRKLRPVNRPPRNTRVATPRTSRRKRGSHDHVASTSYTMRLVKAFPERLSCGSVDESKALSKSLQRIEAHEVHEDGDVQARYILVCLFPDGRRRVSELDIARASREGRAAVTTYWRMRESKQRKEPGDRQPPGIKRLSQAALEQRLGNKGTLTRPQCDRAVPTPPHPADPYDPPPDDERGELEAILDHKVHKSGRATWIKLQCLRASGKKRWESWEWEVEVQRTDNAAVLTYWYHVRRPRPQVTSRYFQIVGHVGEGAGLCFKVQWVGYTACRDITSGLVDVTLEPAKKVKDENGEECSRYANIHNLDIGLPG